MKSLFYKIVAFYIYHFKFPLRGEKYFSSFLKKSKLINSSFKKKLHNGLVINLNPIDHIQKTILWYGFYEKNSVLTWENLIKIDSIIIDIGANIGYYSLIGAEKAANGMVHSFEPVAELYNALQTNIKLNQIKNIIANQAGISDNENVGTYYVSTKDNLGMSGLKPSENYSGFSEEKETATLDAYAIQKGLSKIDFIKIDIEGNEMNALNGMKNILKKCKPVLFIELLNEHLNKFDSNITEIYTFLDNLGYKPFQITKPGNLELLTYFKEDSTIVFINNT